MFSRRAACFLSGFAMIATAAWSYAQHTTVPEAAAPVETGHSEMGRSEAGRYTVTQTPELVLLLDTATGRSWRLNSGGRVNSDISWLAIPRQDEPRTSLLGPHETQPVVAETKCGVFFAPFTRMTTASHDAVHGVPQLVEGDYEPIRARVEMVPIPDDLNGIQPRLAEPTHLPKF